MRRTRSLVLAIATLFAVPGRAVAQDTAAQQRTAAEVLFEEASTLMASGRAPEACPKLVEVVRLQPAGIGAKMKLAECYEAAKQLASAYAAYGFAARAASDAGDPRSAQATERAAALRPRLSTLTIMVAADAPADLEVRRNGSVVGRGQWGTAIPVDGGAQRIEGVARGFSTVVATAAVPDEAGAIVVTLPPLVATSSPSSDAVPTQPPSADARDARDEPIPAWVWVSGGAGIVLGAVAFGFAVDQGAAASTIEEQCGPGRDHCPDDYDADADREREQLDFGLFVGLGAAGAVALGAAVVGLAVSASGGGERTARGPRLTAAVTHHDGYVGLVQPLP